MKKLLLLPFLLFSVLAFAQPNQVILQLKNEVVSKYNPIGKIKLTGNEKIDNVSATFHATAVSRHSAGKKSGNFFYVVEFPSGTNIENVINAYTKTGETKIAEEDFSGNYGGIQSVTPNDQFFARQWSLYNDGTFSLSPSTAGADIDMKNAWSIEQGDSNVIVSIIDTGCKLDHPEFTGRIWKNYAEIPGNNTDDDGNGYIDDVNGYDFANVDNDPTDDEGHGTNVAGIIGANGNNNIGYAGMDWHCKLMILKALDNTGSGFYTWWSDAIYYATDNGAKVISMSVGGTSLSSTLQTAINYALNHNVTVVACMMNANSNTVYYPAGFSGVIAVGSTNSDDTRSNPFFWGGGSDYGSHISVVAPGNYIYGLDYTSNTNYSTYWGGTSQATPHVSGLAALLLAQSPGRTPAQIKSIIENTAEDQVGLASEDVPGFDIYFGHGRINAFQALSTGMGISTPANANNSFSVFPNPSNGELKIIFNDAQSFHVCEIVNALGQTVDHFETNAGTAELNETFAPGIYFVKVKSGSELFTQKIIIQ